jgi:two-component system chemotaxis response regulator CheB
MLDQVSPDIVTLDVEMPVMDGIETLKAIRARRQKLPVIMFSTLTERGAEATIDCLAAGASDYVAKPANVGSFSVSKERICEVLLPKIRALCGNTPQAPQALPGRTLPALSKKTTVSGRIEVVVIGCSTGGPNALAELVPALPADFPVPILIVQHMPPAFTRFLAQRLNASSKLLVKEAVEGAIVEPGTVWIAPGDHHMVAVRAGTSVRLATNQDSPENSCRPSVDVLFRSAAKVYNRATVLALVLTGMGQDGLRGCEQLADINAHIVVQDEETSVVWGMPGYVAKAGLADAVLPLSQLAPYIVRRVAPSGLKGITVPTSLALGLS